MSGFYVLVNHLFLVLTNPVQPLTPGDLIRGRYALDLLQVMPEFLWVWGRVLILPEK